MTVATLLAAVSVSTLSVSAIQQRYESVSCQSDIVSSTVVATFCGHPEGNTLVLDLLILWRGEPGWFHGTTAGVRGSSGSSVSGRGIRGAVSHSTHYGGVTIGFDANFDTRTATVAQSSIDLARVNTVVVDDVDGQRRIGATRWTDPALPLVGDWNLALAQRSGALTRDLRCEIPMPVPPLRQPPVLTVCEKLQNARRHTPSRRAIRRDTAVSGRAAPRHPTASS